jgi:hypothetical protein
MRHAGKARPGANLQKILNVLPNPQSSDIEDVCVVIHLRRWAKVSIGVDSFPYRTASPKLSFEQKRPLGRS